MSKDRARESAAETEDTAETCATLCALCNLCALRGAPLRTVMVETPWLPLPDRWRAGRCRRSKPPITATVAAAATPTAVQNHHRPKSEGLAGSGAGAGALRSRPGLATASTGRVAAGRVADSSRWRRRPAPRPPGRAREHCFRPPRVCTPEQRAQQGHRGDHGSGTPGPSRGEGFFSCQRVVHDDVWPTSHAQLGQCCNGNDLANATVMGTLGGFPNLPALWLRRAEPAFANATVMGTLGGFPNPPALWLRRAEPAFANA